MNKDLSSTIGATKSLFEEYFNKIGSKDFKQFYYDWFSEQMYSPFAELADYFKKHSSQEEFQSFIKDFGLYVAMFNNDNVKNEVFPIKKYSKTKDGQLKNIMDRVDSFSFQVRQYVHSFAKTQEHTQVFVNYRGKTNMAYAYQKGLQISHMIMQNMDKNYALLDNKDNTLNMVDSYMRAKIFKSYTFNDEYNFANKSKFLQELRANKNVLAKLYYANTGDKNDDFIKTFQPEYNDVKIRDNDYLSNGFELEFYYPENIGEKKELLTFLKEKNNWNKIYTSSSDASVYNDSKAAGVIMPDVSLIPYDKLKPIEYASKIMRNKSDEEECLRLLDSFEKGSVNKHCSLHQHIGTENFDLDTYKRLVKRMMQHEKNIIENIAAEERKDNKLLYATYISNNLGSDAKSDYPLLCLMVDICDNKDELAVMTSYGQKYKTLNLAPKNTVEFRYMNAHFNKSFAQDFLKFNRDMVQSAIDNNGNHINKILLNKISWKQNQLSDNKTNMKNIHYLYEFAFDRFDPSLKVSNKVKDGDMIQARLVNHGLNITRQASTQNPMRYGRYY